MQNIQYTNTNTLFALNIQKCFSPKAYTYIKHRYQGNNLPEAIGGIEFSTSDMNYEMPPVSPMQGYSAAQVSTRRQFVVRYLSNTLIFK